ncbi:MAG TPA: cyclopropane-fatty-acyl-phospholipid synthase family protein [Candidatus Paceibacterota bacterium]|nr:cyclopropane-fatty-acyl-phospholipid synthase family protein [Candidatus Paceibacterota bacterium]
MAQTKWIADKVSTLFTEGVPIRFAAFDGSAAGNLQSENILEIKSPLALRYILSHPGDLGLARAYITNHLDVRGDIHATLMALRTYVKSPMPIDSLAKLTLAVGPSALIRPELPIEEAPPRYRRGLLHSLTRDRSAIEHHYDVSNTFYSYILGPTMVYSCAVFDNESSSLEEAQREKVDLICRKLDLKPGMKLLDVGCGWGTLILHAAKEYGVKAVGVTLSKNQVTLARERIVRAHLEESIDIRLQDYREVQDSDFDAISSVGMSEHVGDSKLDLYFSQLHQRIKEKGRILNHCITRPHSELKARTGAFIDRYIFPDGELTAPSRVTQALHNSGFELRHSENLREHYAKTLAKWCENLDANWDDAVKEVGENRARIWNLYMQLCRIGFETNSIQIHQFLGVDNDQFGRNELPRRFKF